MGSSFKFSTFLDFLAQLRRFLMITIKAIVIMMRIIGASTTEMITMSVLWPAAFDSLLDFVGETFPGAAENELFGKKDVSGKEGSEI